MAEVEALNSPEFIAQLRGNEISKTKALASLRAMLNRRNNEIAFLSANLKKDKYSLSELEKLLNTAAQFVKTANKLSQSMSKIDPNDKSLPLLDRLVNKFIDEYKMIRGKLLQMLANKNILNKNIVDITNQFKNTKRPVPRTQKAAPKTEAAKKPTSTIKPIKIQKINLSNQSGLAGLPREAQKLIRENTTAMDRGGATKGSVAYNVNRAGVIVVQPTTGNANTQRAAMDKINQTNRDSAKFWNRFEEKIDVHFDDLKKLLKASTANNNHGGTASSFGGAASFLYDLIAGKLKNSKALRLFSASFYKEAYQSLKSTMRDAFSRGVQDDQTLGKAKQFKAFITKQMRSLNNMVKASWSEAAVFVEKGIDGVIGSVVKGGKNINASLMNFGEGVSSKLGDVKTSISKWSAETISGMEKWQNDFVSVLEKTPNKIASTFAAAVEKSKTIIADLAGKGNRAVVESANSVEDLITNTTKTAQTALPTEKSTSVLGRTSRYLGRVGRVVGKAAPGLNFGAGAALSGIDNNRLNNTTTAKDRIVSGGINLVPGVSEAEMANPLLNRWTRSTFLPGNVQRTLKEATDRMADMVSGGPTDHSRARDLAAEFMRNGKIDSSKLGKSSAFANMVMQQLANMSDEQNARYQNGQDYDENQLPAQLNNANTDFGKRNLQNNGVRRLTNRSIQTQAVNATKAVQAYVDALNKGGPIPESIIADLSPQLQRAAEAINQNMPDGFVPKGSRMGTEQFGPYLPKNAATTAQPAIGATALPDMGGLFKSAQDYIDAGLPVPRKYRNTVPQAQLETNPLLHQTAYDSSESLNPQASAMIGPRPKVEDGAVTVRLSDETIGNLAYVLYRLMRGGKAGGGKGGFIDASYTTGGDNAVSGGTGFGAGGIGGGSNNSVLGGGFGGGNNGTGGGLGGNGATAGDARIGGAQPDNGPNVDDLKDQKAIASYGQAQASLHGEDPKSPLMKGIQDKIDGINGKLGSDPQMKGNGPGKGSLKQNQQEAYNAAREAGYSDKMARVMVSNLSGENLKNPAGVYPDPSRSNPNQKAHGIAAWDDYRSGKIKEHFGKMPNEMGVGDQMRAHIWEINNNPAYATTKRALESGDADLAQRALVNNYENPADKQSAIAGRTNTRQGLESRDFDKGYQQSKQTATAAPTQDDNKIGAPMNGTEPRAGSALAGTAAQANAAMSPTGFNSNIKETQGKVAATRRLPITSELRDQLAFAAEKNGVQAEIFSGGQYQVDNRYQDTNDGSRHRTDPQGRTATGSHRHDNGGAADLRLYKTMPDGSRRQLDMNKPEDAKIMKGFTADAIRAGATGVGAAEGYMGAGGIHIGGGSKAYWGAGEVQGGANPFIAQAYKEGMTDQNSGAGAKEFNEWKAKKAAEAAKNQSTSDNSVTAIDPHSREASIFNPDNHLKVDTSKGLGGIMKQMEGGPKAAAVDPDQAARDKQDQADAEAFHAKVVADAAKNSPYLDREGKGYDATANRPKIDQAAVMKKFGIGGDGTKSEADYSGDTKLADQVAYKEGDFASKPKAFDANGNLIQDKTDAANGLFVDPVKRNQQLNAYRMQQKGLNPTETAQGMGQLQVESDFVPKTENVHYSAAGLHKTFPRLFPTIDSARAVVRQGDSAIANRIYGTRMGNKGYSNAGYNYRGHGEIQLTGRDAYMKMDKALGLNGQLIAHPEMANDPQIAARISAQYLADRKANGFNLSTAKGATSAVGPAGDRNAQIKARGDAAQGFMGRTDDLAAQGAIQSGDTKATMSSDLTGNERIVKQTPVSQDKQNNDNDSSTRTPNTDPGVGKASGGQTKSADPAPTPQSRMTTASNDSSYVPFQHGSLGLCVINSPGLA